MRIATWNVNSLKIRLPKVEEWLAYAQPDVLCMQETKLADSAFPAMAFSALGYESVHCGEGRWNGVAILSRVGIDDVVAGFSDQAEDESVEAWLDRLRRHVETNCDPAADLVICGDFNVAPEDRDAWDPAKLHGGTHISPPEREAVAALRDWGLSDVFRQIYPDTGVYSWWDYRAGDFHQGRGLRIDLVLATNPLAERATS